MKTIIDTDPGVDDAMAIYYGIASEKTEFVGITTVFGNVVVQDATKNALWLGESVGQPIPVYEGAGVPLAITPNPVSAHVHGAHGMGDENIEPPKGKASDIPAAEYLVQAAAAAPGTLTVCAIGPLTNIAQALEIDPNFIANLKQLVIMGGSLRAGGNVTPHAEANFWNDPHAAHKVVTAKGGEIVIVGLDVTTKISFFAEDYSALEKHAPQAGGLLNRIGQFYMAFYESVTDIYQAYLHDPAALICCEDRSYFTFEDVPLAVCCEGERVGEMYLSAETDRTCRVCVGVDADALKAHYINIVSKLP